MTFFVSNLFKARQHIVVFPLSDHLKSVYELYFTSLNITFRLHFQNSWKIPLHFYSAVILILLLYYINIIIFYFLFIYIFFIFFYYIFIYLLNYFATLIYLSNAGVKYDNSVSKLAHGISLRHLH